MSNTNTNALMYHLGFVDDLMYYLSLLAYRRSIHNDNDENKQQNDFNQQPKPIYLSGFSLGANVVLKALGQMGSDAVEKYNVRGASVAGAPFDTERNYLQFHSDPMSRTLYVDTLLKKLKTRAREILRVTYMDDVSSARFDYDKSMNAETIYELESACVAPLFGFEDHIVYYRKTSCGYYLHRIGVPTYIVNARDDPFFDAGYVPWDSVYGGEHGNDTTGDETGGGPIAISVTDHGGHLGYIFHQNNNEDNGTMQFPEKAGKNKSSWISEELARFIGHTHEELFTKEDSARNTVSVSSSSLPLV